MNKRVTWRTIGGMWILVMLLGACRQAGEEKADGAGGNPEEANGRRSRLPGSMTREARPGEVPSKLARKEGRTPDGRPPAPPRYPQAVPIPGNPGYVFSPFTNKPVDVRGIPEGTLVRDPNDPDAEHRFRVPPSAGEARIEDGQEGLSEIPVPEIP